MTIAVLEIQKVSDNYFLIFHKDEATNEIFKFGWTIKTPNDEQNSNVKTLDDGEQRQAREYLNYLVTKNGLLPYCADNLYRKVDEFCVNLRRNKCEYGFMNVMKEAIER